MSIYGISPHLGACPGTIFPPTTWTETSHAMQKYEPQSLSHIARQGFLHLKQGGAERGVLQLWALWSIAGMTPRGTYLSHSFDAP